MIRSFLKDAKDKIPPLAFHTMTDCDGLITIYGGMTAKDEIRGDVYFLKQGSNTFIHASYEKNETSFPKPRHSHSADYDTVTQRLFIFGGYSLDQPNYLNQLCILELKSFPKIVFQTINNINITNRCRHSTFISKGRLYIYGGYGQDISTNKIKILKDFYYLEISSGLLREVPSKGGSDMNVALYKISQLERTEDYAFFSEDLSSFYIFSLDTSTFTKVKVKFTAPTIRDSFSFTINKLKDGRILLLGGSKRDDAFKDIYYLINYTFDQKTYWMWSRMDVFGDVNDGYNGHCALVLENNHLLIHGGTEKSFDWLTPENFKHEPVFTNRLQIFDIHSSLEWLRDFEQHELNSNISYLNETQQSANNTNTNINNTNVGNRSLIRSNAIIKVEQKSSNKNSMMHIMAYIPKEVDGNPKFLIHGGENEDSIVCNYSLFYLNENRLVNSKEEYPNDVILCCSIPQLKGHAWAPLYIKRHKFKDYFIIISGGITIAHAGDRCKVVKAEAEGKLVTNTVRQACNCTNEDISFELYAFRLGFFCKLQIKNEEENSKATLKRFGHSMVYFPDKDLHLILCGYVQYKGYVIDLISLEINRDEELARKNKIAKDMDFALTSRHKEINLEEFNIKGRIHAAVGVANHHVILFGGNRDDLVLNDMYIINLKNIAKPIVHAIANDPKVILPRFGMSGIMHTDGLHPDVSRLMVFGGSSFTQDKMVQGMTNELLVFQIKFNDHDNTIKCDSYAPTVYGFSQKKVFHSAYVHEDNMYVYGGLNTKFQVLNIPAELSYEVDYTVKEYERIFHEFSYDDWINNKTSKNKDIRKLKNDTTMYMKTEQSNVEEKGHNISNFILPDNKDNFTRNNSKSFSNDISKNEVTIEGMSNRSKDKLISGNDTTTFLEEKSLRSNDKNVSPNISQNMSQTINESKPFIEKKWIFGFLNPEKEKDKDKELKNINIKKNNVVNNNTKAVKKGKNNKVSGNNWDDDYD